MTTKGRLTTHVLDTAHGRPGADIRIDLYLLEAPVAMPSADAPAESATAPAFTAPALRRLASMRTNDDGRCDRPLLEGPLPPGTYELHFAVGEYFARCGGALAEPRFLDTVVLRFGIADAHAHYHVPLLVSPWSYSTYRGS
ncbi:hydroxyisourate hydrolase [Robbsia sp. Bb-Pol-6]|uniref:5-hydroxyisourate hydrolase n=1 Tax=Robbsia betulipollinis TaxID=2981849 RepID=A0ABT3ZGW2_9BURK|nr:hydroxyisourate hydrolase [Robbsia betulipollinis]MCY0385763.1 hydroxyisourate hydrolase [Robbsia betulipollinis]